MARDEDLKHLTRTRLYEWALKTDEDLGQHFLVDDDVLDKIVAAAELGENDRVLEVGAGLGFLTEELCESAGHVTALEVDDKLYRMLEHELSYFENLNLAKTPFSEGLLEDWLEEAEWGEPGEESDDPDTNKLVTNLPYQITGQFLGAVVDNLEDIERCVVMVQREVANRLTAEPRTKAYGSLTVSTRTFADVFEVVSVSPDAFIPQPRVHSKAINIRSASQRPGVPADLDRELYQRFVKAAFSNRRKNLVNSISATMRDLERDRIADAMQACGIPRQTRAEELEYREFIELFQELFQGAGVNSESGDPDD